MNLEPPFDRITIEPGKMGGQPSIRGMRITVRRVLEILATYPDRVELFADYPDLHEEDLQQALGFAAATRRRYHRPPHRRRMKRILLDQGLPAPAAKILTRRWLERRARPGSRNERGGRR